MLVKIKLKTLARYLFDNRGEVITLRCCTDLTEQGRKGVFNIVLDIEMNGDYMVACSAESADNPYCFSFDDTAKAKTVAEGLSTIMSIALGKTPKTLYTERLMV